VIRTGRELTLHEFEVANLPGSVHLVRSFVSHEISQLPLSDEARSDLVSAVAEAANNAAVHGTAAEGRPNTVLTRITRLDSAVRVRVRDNGRGFRPKLREWKPPDLMAERGRGVFIMKTLADEVAYPRVRRGTLCLLTKRFDEPVRESIARPEESAKKRRGEGVLREPENMPPVIYRSLIENALEGVWVIDTEAKTVFVNNRTAKMLGYSAREMLGHPLRDFLAPESVQLHERVKERDRTGKSQQFEQDLRRRDGSIIHVLIATSPLYDETGRYAGSLGLLTDITERKRSEDELRESENRYRSLFGAMREGFAYCRMMFDKHDRPADFVYLQVNNAFPRLTGLRKVEGKRVTEVIPGIRRSNPEIFQVYGRVTRSGETEQIEVYLDQLKKWLSVTVYGLPPDHFVAVFDDVTERKLAARQAKEQLEASEVLIQAAQALTSHVELDKVMKALADVLLRLTGHKRMAVALYNEDRKDMTVLYAAGDRPFQAGLVFPYESIPRPVRKLTKERRAKIVDYDRLPKEATGAARAVGARLGLVAPLVLADRLVGIVSIDTPDERVPFDERSVRLVEAISSQAAAVAQNARLLQTARENEARCASMFDAVREGFARYQAVYGKAAKIVDLRVLDVNPAGAALSGKPREQQIGRTWRELWPDVDPQLFALYEQADVTGRRVRFEDHNAITGRWYDVRIQPIERGEFAATFVDVTELKETEAEQARLLEAERRAEELTSRLNEINLIINSILRPEEIMGRVVDEAAAAMRADSVVLDLPEDGMWVPRYTHGLPEILGRRFRVEEVPFLDEAIRTKRPVDVADAFEDPRARPEIQRQYGIPSVLVAPVVSRNEVIGAIFFNYHRAPHSFTSAEKDFASGLAAALAISLQNAQLYEHERMVADTLQTALLTMPGRLDHLDFAYQYRGASEAVQVGGDFYDLFSITPARIGITVGDVSGKGLDAAVIMSTTKSIIRANAIAGAGPEAVMQRTDSMLHEEVPPDIFVTTFFAVIDLPAQSLTYCNAGHPQPFLRHRNGEVEQLAVTGPLLAGPLTTQPYESVAVTLAPNELLFLYTDGLIEARTDGEMFGEERVGRILAGLEPVESRQAIDAVVAELTEFSAGRLQDDMALLAVRRMQ